MTNISEAITTIKKAETDAEKLIEDSEVKATEMINEAKAKSAEMLDEAKKEAREESEVIISEAEDNAKNEAVTIKKPSDSDVAQITSQSKGKVDDAAKIIVENVL